MSNFRMSTEQEQRRADIKALDETFMKLEPGPQRCAALHLWGALCELARTDDEVWEAMVRAVAYAGRCAGVTP